MKTQTLQELVSSGSVIGARLVGLQGGFGITICLGSAESLLASSRGEVRRFTLDTATKYLRQIGISRFEVDASNFEPGRMRKPRPDRAEALRNTRTTPRQATLV